ncbi:MAG: hypothetical protein Q8O40_01460 [Chloroflexota bacterium]|nr:hypothetical protein [Chloroflexota bacterium]
MKPQEALHVGDQYRNDVVGARGVGIQPLLLDRYGLEAEADCPCIRSLADIEKYLDKSTN